MAKQWLQERINLECSTSENKQESSLKSSSSQMVVRYKHHGIYVVEDQNLS